MIHRLFDKFYRSATAEYQDMIRNFLIYTNDTKLEMKLKSILEQINMNKLTNYIKNFNSVSLNFSRDDVLNSQINDLDLTDLEMVKLKKMQFSKYKNLESLILVNNKVRNLEVGCFLGQEKLLKLNLSCNEITKLRERNILKTIFKIPPMNLDKRLSYFYGLDSLKELNLFSNQINKIEKNTFKVLVNLELLKLDSNEITSIDIGSFNGLNKLKLLDLSSNKINKLKKNNFIGLDDLEILNLMKNNFRILKTGCFNNLTKLKELNLSNNNAKRLEKKSLMGLKNLENIKLIL